jgi:glutathione S-transferase
MFWCAQHFAPAIRTLTWENLLKPMLGQGPPDPDQVSRGEAQVRAYASLLDQHLEKASAQGSAGQWVAEGHLTLADIALATPLMTLEQARLPVKAYGHLMAWFDKIQELEAWKQTQPPTRP